MSSSPLRVEAFEAENVRGYLHKAANDVADGMVLTHGAGGNCQTPLLIAVSEAFQTAGVTVLRCDLPFRQRKPKGVETRKRTNCPARVNETGTDYFAAIAASALALRAT